jgi:hypothetical protein
VVFALLRCLTMTAVQSRKRVLQSNNHPLSLIEALVVLLPE